VWRYANRMQENKNTRPPLASLACVNELCDLYGQQNQDNLTIRKVYGKANLRYLRCRCCQEEFSERKGTALWNVKVPEEKAIAIAEHLAEGCSFKSTARLVKVDPETVRRMNRRLGRHSYQFHDERVWSVAVGSLQADERWGYAVNKQNPVWEAELMDPASKFVIAHVQGKRNEALIRRLLTEGAKRLFDKHKIVLFTDGFVSYATLFPEIFGVPYQQQRLGRRGRQPQVRYRIPRDLAHIQIVKQRSGKRLHSIDIRYKHGTKKRADAELVRLHYAKANTSAVERRNATARLMNSTQQRRTLAFARHDTAKLALGWWTLTVYNWCRPHRMLRSKLDQYLGKKQYAQRTPAMAVGVAFEMLTVEMIIRTQVFQGKGWG
jgi:IS1 family transposase/transposase-like protein